MFFWKSLKKLELSPLNSRYGVLHLLYSDTTCCELVFFEEFNEQSLVKLWVTWCKNEGFWKRFTCNMYVVVPTAEIRDHETGLVSGPFSWFQSRHLFLETQETEANSISWTFSRNCKALSKSFGRIYSIWTEFLHS